MMMASIMQVSLSCRCAILQTRQMHFTSTGLEEFVTALLTDPVPADGSIIPDVEGEGYAIFGAPLNDIGPLEDYDADGTSNIAELLLASNPTNDNDAGIVSNLEAYTAEGLAGLGTFSLPAPEGIGPAANLDNDLVNNALELMLGFDPTDAASGPATNTLEYFVAEQLFLLDAFANYQVSNYGPLDDLDGDGMSNISELQLGSDPTDPGDVATANEIEITLSESFAEAGVFVGETFNAVLVTAADLDSDADFDGDGESNLFEWALGWKHHG